MTSSINNSSPDPMTSYQGSDINASSIDEMFNSAAFSGMAEGVSGGDSNTDDLTVSASSSNSDTYYIGVKGWDNSTNSVYNPTGSADFYNIGITNSESVTTKVEKAQAERETEYNNFRRAMNGIRI